MTKLKYLNGATQALKWSVLYPIDDENSKIKKKLYFLWSIFFISSIIITICQCVTELVTKPFDILEESTIVMNTAVYAMIVSNFILFYYHANNLSNLVKNINENFVEETDNEIEDVNMKKAVKISDYMTFSWTLSLINSAVLLASLPVIGGSLPIPIWFPYDTTKSPFYEISCIWQIICQINLGIIYGGSDMIYPSMTLIIGQQFRILANNFKNSFYYALVKCGLPRDTVIQFKNEFHNKNLFQLFEKYGDIFAVTDLQIFNEIVVGYFKKNVRHHQILLRYCEDLNQIMSLFLLSKVVAAFFNVTFIAFSLITSGDYTMLVGLCSYVFFASTELIIYTYGGQILTESADFLSALYDVPFYLCNSEFKKLFLIVQIRVNKMICTKAGNYFQMHAPSFITFMRSIFSYIALLKQLTDSDRSGI